MLAHFFRSRSKGQPLLLNDDGSSTGFPVESFNSGGIKLYDASVMLELPKSVCEGYVTLLTGGAAAAEQPATQRQTTRADDDDKEQAALPLAYAALTGGNVIDACFGARPGSSTAQQARTLSTTLTKEAKDKLDQVAEEDERVEKIAVLAYLQAFRTIIKMHKDISKLNIITACFCTKKIRTKATAQLAIDFSQLEQALKKGS
jgi:hypothetical protein